MKTAAFLAPLIALALTGCNGYSPSTLQSRGMAFPLDSCFSPASADKHSAASKLAKARAVHESNAEVLSFSRDWVCVTRTRAKADLDNQKAPAKGPSDGERALSEDEAQLRTALEASFLSSTGQSNLGIALAGGGSKAAAFGSGVLSGLADIDLLDNASYISTVSGGGYAAYFYYTHKILPAVRYKEEVPSSKSLFHDCVRYPGKKGRTMKEEKPTDLYAVTEVLNKIVAAGACDDRQLTPSRTDEAQAMKVRYQALVRCQQDVLKPGICSVETTEGDVGISGFAVLTTLLTAIPSWFSSSIFDWGLTTSVAAITYRDGIGMAYGNLPTNMGPLMTLGVEGRIPRWKRGDSDVVMPVDCSAGATGFARECRPGPYNVQPIPMRFDELRQGLLAASQAGKPLPFWIINAVAPESRSTLGWWSDAGKTNTTSSDIFEMTPVSHGSGRYGFVSAPMSLHGFTVLDSVGAAAAFLDPNQNVEGGKHFRGPLGVVQRFFNLDWGIDISNYNVRDARRTLHTAMPFPIFDSPVSRHILHAGQSDEAKERVGSVFIRLIDGGNGENLGLYSLVKRGAKNIVIADAAGDPRGRFSDICEVRRRLKDAPDRTPRHLHIPGLKGLKDHCDRILTEKKRSYGIHRWPFEFPVLVGCVRVSSTDEGPAACDNLGKNEPRLFVVKPAMNMDTFSATQLEQIRKPGGRTMRQITQCRLPGDEYAAHDDQADLLNCESSAFLVSNWDEEDGNNPLFPQHSTIFATANSSHTIYAAYRELGRQYTARLKTLLQPLSTERAGSQPVAGSKALEAATQRFEAIAKAQYGKGLTSQAKGQ